MIEIFLWGRHINRLKRVTGSSTAEMETCDRGIWERGWAVPAQTWLMMTGSRMVCLKEPELMFSIVLITAFDEFDCSFSLSQCSTSQIPEHDRGNSCMMESVRDPVMYSGLGWAFDYDRRIGDKFNTKQSHSRCRFSYRIRSCHRIFPVAL